MLVVMLFDDVVDREAYDLTRNKFLVQPPGVTGDCQHLIDLFNRESTSHDDKAIGPFVKPGFTQLALLLFEPGIDGFYRAVAMQRSSSHIEPDADLVHHLRNGVAVASQNELAAVEDVLERRHGIP